MICCYQKWQRRGNPTAVLSKQGLAHISWCLPEAWCAGIECRAGSPAWPRGQAAVGTLWSLLQTRTHSLQPLTQLHFGLKLNEGEGGKVLSPPSYLLSSLSIAELPKSSCCSSESWNHQGWKNLSRSSSPTVNPALLYTLNH